MREIALTYRRVGSRPLLAKHASRTLNEFCLKLGIVLRHIHDCVVFVDRQPLVRDRLFQSFIGFFDDAFLIIRRCGGGDTLLVVLVHPGDCRQCRCRGIQLSSETFWVSLL